MITSNVVDVIGRKDNLVSGGCLDFRGDVWALRS